MYEFYEEESLELSKTILDELILHDISEFNPEIKSERLIIHILKAIQHIKNNTNKLEKGKRVYVQSINCLHSNELVVFSNIFNQYLNNTYKGYKMEIDYIEEKHETRIYCYDENYKHYIVSSIFPNENVINDVKKDII